METMIITGSAPAVYQAEPEISLDNRASELSDKQQWHNDKEKDLEEYNNTLPFLPILQHPLLKTLVASLQGTQKETSKLLDKGVGKTNFIPEHVSRTNEKSARTTLSTLQKDKLTAEMYLPVAKLPLPVGNLPLQAVKMSAEQSSFTSASLIQGALDLAPTNDASILSTQPRPVETVSHVAVALTKMKASERQKLDESVIPLPQQLQALSPNNLKQNIDLKTLTRPPLHSQLVEVPDSQQSGLTYRFSRWGGDSAVTVHGVKGGALLLQPSDALVAHQLSEQWQSGDPDKWKLSRDGSEGHEKRNQQHYEEDDA